MLSKAIYFLCINNEQVGTIKKFLSDGHLDSIDRINQIHYNYTQKLKSHKKLLCIPTDD